MSTLNEARNLVNEGKIEFASASLTEYLNEAPDDSQARYLLGVCNFRQKKFEAAEESFKESIKLDTSNFSAAYYLGLTLERQNRLPEAKYCFEYTSAFDESYAKTPAKLAELEEIQSIQAFEAGGAYETDGRSLHPRRFYQRDKSTKKKQSTYSAKGNEISRLKRFLQNGDWKKADQETRKTLAPLLSTPAKWSEDSSRALVAEIDNLWTENSEGRFGFSVQKRIYQSVGGLVGPDGYNSVTFLRFLRQVSWYVTKKTGFRSNEPAIMGRANLSYALSAPVGHLPAAWALPKSDALLPGGKRHFFAALIFYILWGGAAIFMFGLIGMLIGGGAGLIIGAGIGFLISLQVPGGAIKKRRQRKKASGAVTKLMKLFDRLPP